MNTKKAQTQELLTWICALCIYSRLR